jgi:hypothetical protein
MHDIEELELAVIDKLNYFANAIIRDAKTRKAYGVKKAAIGAALLLF